MLAAIRGHLAASTPFDAVRKEHQARQGDEKEPDGARAREVGASACDASTSSPELDVGAVSRVRDASTVDLFRASVESVAGHCFVVRDEAEASKVVRQVVEQRGARRVAVSDSPLVRRVVAQAGTDAELIEDADAPTLFDCDLGITSAQWGVAETGTLVLESDGERHRLASLVPPVHVALVEAARIRRTLAEVLKSICESGADALSRTVTFITGPSRTSDIELTLAIGVHGPGELYVVVIEDAQRE